MIEPLLKSKLQPIARRQQSVRLALRLALAWAVLAVVGFFLLSIQRLSGVPIWFALPALGVAAPIVALLVWKQNRKWEPDYRELARRIEEKNPELHALLLTAVEQQPDRAGQLNFLQQRVISDALVRAQNENWIESVSGQKLFLARLANFAALVLLLVVITRPGPATSAKFEPNLFVSQEITVTPGDTSVERGNSLVVLARFAGRIPPEATLVVIGGEKEKRLPLIKNLDDPVFGGSLPNVDAGLIYRVEYSGRQTRDYKVKVFEHPRLERADARLHYPSYTSLPDKKIDDTRRVSAVEGTVLNYTLQLNKPVASATLVPRTKEDQKSRGARDGEKQENIALLVETNRAVALLNDFDLTTSRSYELQLVDTEGRTNRTPAQFVFDVLKNRTPELKIIAPRGDQRVTSLQEMKFEGEAWDDFGMQAYGISYTVPGSETQTIALSKTNSAGGKQPFSYLLKLEDLAVKTDQLVSYFIWADDVGPDGKTRRTYSDMYFAEIRPFEEIFRQGQPQESDSSSQQQQGEQQGNQSAKLAELQKQIINATWKLQRQEKSEKPSAQYLKDAPIVRDSQNQALEQASALKERAANERIKGFVEIVEQEMQKAVDRLEEATKSTKPLASALEAEQAAYQAILKLAAREFEVSRNRSRGSQSGQQQANQRQIDQLDLKMSENRYETQRQATPQQNAQQREQSELLNRLKELAQRQQDLNDRLKELQNALQEARNEQEREDVRRQLKRLHEEQREMLADVDELKQKMEQPQNQSRMADARQQLDRTRAEMQRAAEALDKDAVPQALTEGTRAQRDLQQLRDDVRKKNSSQFADDVKQLRNDARELAQKQEDVEKKLDAIANPRQKTLSDSGDKKEIAADLDQQKQRMTNLLENATHLSEQSETTEPVLSKQLYDTIRKAMQDDVKNLKEMPVELANKGQLTMTVRRILESGKEADKKAVEVTAELLRGGFVPEASQLEQRAKQGIDDLKRGVERAAESVLGDETEALRLAKKELDDLSQQLEREMAQSQAQGPSGDPNNSTNRQPGQVGQNGENGQDGQQQTAQNSQAQQGQRGQRGEQGQQGQQGQGQRGERGQQGQQAQQGQGQGERGQQAQQGQGQQGQQGQGQGQQAQQGQGQGQGQGNGQAQNSNQQTARNDAENNSQNGGQRNGGQRNGGTRNQAGGSFLRNTDGGWNGGWNGGGAWDYGPITGPNYTEWSDRLGNVEEMVDQPDLRNDLSRIREQARTMRVEYKRLLKKPDWAVVKLKLVEPLAEVRNRLNQELAKRESNQALVPIDRDPVPNRFSELVRRYYENLGKSE
jgi:hypothetical protein